MAELDGRRIAAVLAADTELDVGASGAAQIKHFRQVQVFNEIDGLLDRKPDIMALIGDMYETANRAGA